MGNNVVPIILCGGTGSRLWPMSRKSFPKQYLSVKKGSELSLLQKTIKRILDFKNIEKPIIICNEEHRFIVLDQLEDIKVDVDSIILEPCGRNTAPAIAIAALKLKDSSNKNLLVLSADHEIKNSVKFLDIIEKATKYADQSKLVTFGIEPTKPETGYGYIEVVEDYKKEPLKALNIKRFTEKPNKEKAIKFLSEERYLWNSGIFLFNAKIIIDEISKFSPDIIQFCLKALKESKKDLAFTRLSYESFSKCPNISIDNAVMEKTESAVVLPLDVGWSDVGSWKSIWEIEKKDENNNVSQGKVVIKNSENCYLRSSDRLIVGLGIKNLTIVETNDAILVLNNEYDQQVKNITKQLEKDGFVEGEVHKEVYRPWGNYITLSEGENWQVKKIKVKIGASLSLQLHNHRSEHWIVVSGKAKVELNNDTYNLEVNQSTYIPKNSKHRLSNIGKDLLILIEVQSGEYLGEDDIIRFKDMYGR